MHIFGLLSIETFVLVASLLLFAYVKKNALGKWFQIESAAIIIFMLVLMVGTCFTACMNCCGGGNRSCGSNGKHQMMMNQCSHGGGSCPMMNNTSCSGGNSGCCSGMDGMSGATGCMKNGMTEDIEINIDGEEGSDSIKKKVVIKKVH